MQRTQRQRLISDLSESRKGMLRDFLVGAIEAVGESDLTMVQLAALSVLSEGGEQAVSQLAAALRRSLSATSRLVEQLVRRRLVTRRPGSTDRRQRHVALAVGGSRLLELLLARRAEAQLGLMEQLSAAEQARVAEGTALLAAAARRRAEKEVRR